MHDKNLFEYAVIRIVPKVEREEFLNAGIVMYCSSKKFLAMQFDVNETKLCSFSNKINIGEINQHMVAFNLICEGAAEGGPIAMLGMPERFRWLTATRSTIIQTSKVHPGFCDEPEKKLEELFEKIAR